jgi:predicted Rossmann fold nucleotide-binding protein DprA/Smf involved in DNA uptake
MMANVKDQLKSLSKDLASIAKKVDKLSKQVDKTKPAAKKAVKKTAAKKTTAKKTAPKKTTAKTKASKGQTVLDSVYDVIRRSRKGVNIATLKAKTNLDARQLSNALYKLSKKGSIKSVSRGVYTKS